MGPDSVPLQHRATDARDVGLFLPWAIAVSSHVVCQTPDGGPANSPFTLSYHRASGLLGTGNVRVAYAWADQPTSSVYTPKSFYSFNSAFGAISITRSARGVYQVRFGGLGTSRGHVQVTAYGSSDAAWCKVASWLRSGPDELVNVRCYSASGLPFDARYLVDFVD
jgi:hypothetical protein